MTRTLSIFALALISTALTACTTQQRSPDEIRRETANATSTAARDAKAVAQGVADGLKHGHAVNINKASDKDLETLPGIDEATAGRIIANRPYDNSDDLVKKHVIARSDYDHIADKVTTQ
jgi:DNA uptake protein ComE-like DNA-binding protein